MKTVRILSSTFLLASLFTACKRDTIDEQPSIVVNKTTIGHPLTSGSETLTITSNIEWKLTIPTTATWLTADVTSGSKGTTKINLTFSENKDVGPMITDLILSGNNVSDIKIHVVQDGSAPYINVDRALISVEPGATEDSIAITANTDWNLEVPTSATWLTVDKTIGSAGITVVHFTMPANISLDTLRVQLIINALKETTLPPLKINLEHIGDQPYADVDKTTLHEKKEGQKDSIAVTSNTNWTISIPADATWIHIDQTDGHSGKTNVHFMVDPNSSSSIRETDITLSSVVSGVTPKKVHVSQDPDYYITDFSPKTGPAGTEITITGYFSAAAAPEVKLNGKIATVKSFTASNIVFVVPNWSTSGKITINNSTATLTSASSFTVNPAAWNRVLGGSGYDAGYSIVATSDGGCVMAGFAATSDVDVSGNHGGGDFWVAKFDASGGIVWNKAYGGSGEDIAHSIAVTPDGGFIVVGSTQSNDGDVNGYHQGSVSGDGWIIKLDAGGNLIWQRALGGSGQDEAKSVIVTADGGYLISGFTGSDDITKNINSMDAWIVKLNASGTTVWQKALGGTGWDYSNSITNTTDGGYVMVGYTDSKDGDVTGNYGSYDAWAVKLDGSGNIIWSKNFGGSKHDALTSVLSTADGGCIMAGNTSSNDFDVSSNRGKEDFWVIKLNAAGGISWQKTYGSSGTDAATSIAYTSDGGYLVAGAAGSNDGDVIGNHGNYNAWILKIDGSGTLISQQTFGGDSYEAAQSIAVTSDGGYFFTGVTSSINGDAGNNHGYDDAWILHIGKF